MFWEPSDNVINENADPLAVDNMSQPLRLVDFRIAIITTEALA